MHIVDGTFPLVYCPIIVEEERVQTFLRTNINVWIQKPYADLNLDFIWYSSFLGFGRGDFRNLTLSLKYC